MLGRAKKHTLQDEHEHYADLLNPRSYVNTVIRPERFFAQKQHVGSRKPLLQESRCFHDISETFHDYKANI